jgi:hypothetical protein
MDGLALICDTYGDGCGLALIGGAYDDSTGAYDDSTGDAPPQ